MAYAVFPAGEQEFSAPSGGDLSRSIFRLSDSLRQTRANIWRYPPGARGRRHAEHVQEEVFVVLEGTATLYLGDPAEAVELAWSHQGPIDMLITDALMPELNGQELAEHILALRPTIRVVFISNYAEEHLFRDNPMPAHARFLRKPIHPAELRETVRAMLEENGPNQSN